MLFLKQNSLWVDVLSMTFIPIIVLSALAWLFYYSQIYRKKKIQKLIAEAAKEDIGWNQELLIKFTILTYKYVQLAYNNADIKLLKGVVNEHFIKKYGKTFINTLPKPDNSELLDQMEIDVEILGMQDFIDIRGDRFSALIKEKDKDLVIYHFARFETSWLLDGIQLDVSFNGKTIPPIFREERN